jgi:hypothetical protein
MGIYVRLSMQVIVIYQVSGLPFAFFDISFWPSYNEYCVVGTMSLSHAVISLP